MKELTPISYLDKDFKRLKIKADEAFVLEIEHHGVPVAELIVRVEQLTYELKNGRSEVKISVVNPAPVNRMENIIIQHNL